MILSSFIFIMFVVFIKKKTFATYQSCTCIFVFNEGFSKTNFAWKFRIKFSFLTHRSRWYTVRFILTFIKTNVYLIIRINCLICSLSTLGLAFIKCFSAQRILSFHWFVKANYYDIFFFFLYRYSFCSLFLNSLHRWYNRNTSPALLVVLCKLPLYFKECWINLICGWVFTNNLKVHD